MSLPTTEFDFAKHRESIIAILKEIQADPALDNRGFQKLINRWGKQTKRVFTKNDLMEGLKKLQEEDNPLFPIDNDLLRRIQMKPIRTMSGVTTVTVLTKPFPCPGECIFCPNDVRMPKSYIASEPGAQRALKNQFDPYLQTYNRLDALRNIGHDTDKVEIIILGGTWSYYSEGYQIWFIKRIFEALNDFGEGVDQRPEILERIKNQKWQEIKEQKEIFRNTNKNKRTKTYNHTIKNIVENNGQKLVEEFEKTFWEELFVEHQRNELADSRCVGLVIETRPDNISPAEAVRIRKLGCTKTQIGFQSLNDEVLTKNHRGHDVTATRRAVKLLRQAGFKIHAHWMANLYGSSPEKDMLDYQKIFEDPDFRPDELKIYPCSLIETAELMDYYKQGLWEPYTTTELLEVVSKCISNTPEYCRLTRIIRDIPGTDIVTGNKITNFRELAEKELDNLGIEKKDIRSREIRGQTVSLDDLQLKIIEYSTSTGTEKFLQFVTIENKIAGFLRLSLPDNKTHPFISELSDAAIIREIHVYGKAVNIGNQEGGKAQHLGLGKQLIEKACQIASEANYPKLAVISSVGTREYYRKRGFTDGVLYQFRSLENYVK